MDENNSFPAPESISIYKLYPNPSNTSFTMTFSSTPNEQILISIHDILGRPIKQTTHIPSNFKSYFTWNGLDQNGQPVSSGLFIISVSNGFETKSKKVTLLK